MAESALDKIQDKLTTAIFGALVAIAGGFVLSMLWGRGPTPEQYASNFVVVVGGSAALAIVVLFGRYQGILAGASGKKGSKARKAYEALRVSVTEGGTPARIYIKSLSAVLGWTDRFFGDASKARETLFPHAFGLKTPAPLWTAESFHQCLLLAFCYPLVVIFLVWAISGHVGPAEEALHLNENIGWEKRAVTAFAFAWSAVFGWTVVQSIVNQQYIRIISQVAAFLLLSVAGQGAVRASYFDQDSMAVFAGCATVSLTLALYRSHFADNFSMIGGTLPLSFGLMSRGFSHLASSFVIVVVFAAAFTLADEGRLRLKRQRIELIYFALYVPALIAIYFFVAYAVSAFQGWAFGGPLLLFLGLFTIINAPFDWLSLGLTRALLRRGLELGGWWPFVLAIVDAIFAVVIVAMLAVSMVLSTQTFDFLAVLGGGTPILPLAKLFSDLATKPGAPEFWWIYALLFSTMIPSVVNLVIGGMSLTRGIPWLSRHIRAKMTASHMPRFDRSWLAGVLTLQVCVGVILGVVVQAAVIVLLFVYLLPWVGLSLLDMVRYVAALQLPARLLLWLMPV